MSATDRNNDRFAIRLHEGGENYFYRAPTDIVRATEMRSPPETANIYKSLLEAHRDLFDMDAKGLLDRFCGYKIVRLV